MHCVGYNFSVFYFRNINKSIKSHAVCLFLHFKCSLDRPVITYFVTVTFREELVSHIPSLVRCPHPTPVKNEALNPEALVGIAHSDQGKEHMQVDVVNKDSAPNEDNEDRRDEYWCRIVEEPPSPAHDQ